jgi:hypothetical protein
MSESVARSELCEGVATDVMDRNNGRIRELFAGVTSGYDTHRPVLCEAVMRTTGPILELGVGEGSTLSLSAVAKESSRRVFSFDTDPQWIERFLDLRNRYHFIARVSSWDDCPIDSHFWSVVFVDHAPAGRRIVDIVKLAYRAELLVIHDTDEPEYGFEPILSSFTSRFDYREYKQWTTVVSNYRDLSNWRINP